MKCITRNAYIDMARVMAIDDNYDKNCSTLSDKYFNSTEHYDACQLCVKLLSA